MHRKTEKVSNDKIYTNYVQKETTEIAAQIKFSLLSLCTNSLTL